MGTELEQSQGTQLPSIPRRYRPAYEIAAARAAINGDKIADELLRQALGADKDSDRRAAIVILLDMEQRVRQERRDEEDHFSKLEGHALDEAIAERIQEMTGVSMETLRGMISVGD